METIKKIKIILILTIALLLLGCTYVFAENETNTTITLEGETTVAPGTTSTLAMKVTSNSTIGIVSGKIVCDSNIVIEAEGDVGGTNGWFVTYNTEDGSFIAYKAQGATEEEIINISYTVSSTEGTGTITISEIEMVDIQYNAIEIEDVTKEITIKKEVTGIEITTTPSKTAYIEGENFSTSGMVVKANYNDGSSKTVTNYTIIDGNNLKAGQTSVTISYTENGVTKTAAQAITVEAKLNITISCYETTQENGTKYIEGIKLGTTIQGVLNNIETNGTAKAYKATIRITDGNTKAVTGMTIKISLGTQEETYTLVVTGDLNGNGQMGNVDLLKLVRYNAGLDINLSGAYLKAADIYKDGRYADNKDILKMARVLAGLDSL